MGMTEMPAPVSAPPGWEPPKERKVVVERVRRQSWFAWFPFLSLFEL